MNYCKIIIAFFNDFSRGETIAIIAIFIAVVIFIATLVFIIWWDTKKKRQDRIDVFIEPLLQLKAIIETKSIPDHAGYDRFITDLFAKQESAMSVIRNRMDRKTKADFDKKWAEYKKERERYKHYWDTDLRGKVSFHVKSSEIINIIDEVINITKKI